jgi:hypothetical protein
MQELGTKQSGAERWKCEIGVKEKAQFTIIAKNP